jgi:hypothetical protein
MAARGEGPDIQVTDEETFNQGVRGLVGARDAFQDGIGTTVGAVSKPAASGEMTAGKDLITALSAAGTTLVNYLSTVADGMVGYQTAVAAIGAEYNGMVVLNNQRLQSVLRPHEGPVKPLTPSA